MLKLRILALFSGLAAVLATAGCSSGGGSGGPANTAAPDSRDAIVGTWAGAVTLPASKSPTIGSNITFQVLKATGSTGVEGAYQVSVPLGISSIVVQFGSFAATYSSNQLTGTLTACMDVNGVPLSAPQQKAGTVSILFGSTKSGRGAGPYTSIWDIITQDIQENYSANVSQTSGSTTPNLNLAGTTWTGLPANNQGLVIPNPTKPGTLLGTFQFSATFATQDASNNLTGTITGSLPSGTLGGKSFTLAFSSGVVTGNVVTISGTLPAGTPAIPLGTSFSLPMAGREFQYSGPISGSIMGGSASSFSFQLTSLESTAAALFGVTLTASPTDGYFIFGTAAMTKVTSTTGGTGEISVPIE